MGDGADLSRVRDASTVLIFQRSHILLGRFRPVLILKRALCRLARRAQRRLNVLRRISSNACVMYEHHLLLWTLYTAAGVNFEVPLRWSR